MENKELLNMFWLGHNLMWTMTTLNFGGDIAAIMRGLDSIKQHLHQIKYQDIKQRINNDIYKIMTTLSQQNYISDFTRTDCARLVAEMTQYIAQAYNEE